MAGEARKKFREEVGGGGVERGVEGGGELGVRGGLGLELGEAEGDRAFDLVREVEVVAGDVREEGVDEMQTAQVVAGGGASRGTAELNGSSSLIGVTVRQRRSED